jgi:hypothetical protein
MLFSEKLWTGPLSSPTTSMERTSPNHPCALQRLNLLLDTAARSQFDCRSYLTNCWRLACRFDVRPYRIKYLLLLYREGIHTQLPGLELSDTRNYTRVYELNQTIV